MAKKHNLILSLILMIAFLVRFNEYASFPIFGETQDEVAWTWMGTSILQGKHPTTWSGTNLEGYSTSYETYLGDVHYRIVSPYLDNPHLFSLIPGSIALLKGVKNIELPPITVIRFPMIIIGTLNVFLLYLVSKKLFNQKIAYISTLLYATIPTFVYSSRLVMAENFLITLMLLSLYLLADLEKNNHKQIILLGVIGGVSILTKIAGLSIVLASFAILLSNQNTKAAFKYLGVALAIGSIYPLYGLLTNSQLFMDVITKQSAFKIGMSTLIDAFIYPQLVQKTLIDGWIYLGYFSLFTFMFIANKTTAQKTISTFSIVWLLFIIATTPEVTSHGWYKYPLFPLMSVAIAHLFSKIINYKYAIPIFSFLVLLPLTRLVLISNGQEINHLLVRGLLALSVAPILIPKNFFNKLSFKKVFYGLLLTSVILNIMLVYKFKVENYWEDSLHFYPIRSGV